LILGAGEEGPGLKPVFIAALIVTAEAVTYRLATHGNLFWPPLLKLWGLHLRFFETQNQDKGSAAARKCFLKKSASAQSESFADKTEGIAVPRGVRFYDPQKLFGGMAQSGLLAIDET
jgi:hypothetical protein